jgi:hypothetical protein
MLAAPPAIIEPALRDMPPFAGLEVSDSALVDVVPLDEEPWETVERQAHAAAFADDRVRERLDGRRHVVIGVSRPHLKRTRERTLVLVAFCYDDGLAYEVTLAEDRAGLVVRDIVDRDYQPRPRR